MSRRDLPLVHPNLTVADVERSIAFYRLWFDPDGYEVEVYREPPG